ncbi:hypothetical protein NCC78_29695, partial [Micromonospora phytophila]|nr:hypothetical protein [Micromonospora phytophila]
MTVSPPAGLGPSPEGKAALVRKAVTTRKATTTPESPPSATPGTKAAGRKTARKATTPAETTAPTAAVAEPPPSDTPTAKATGRKTARKATTPAETTEPEAITQTALIREKASTTKVPTREKATTMAPTQEKPGARKVNAPQEPAKATLVTAPVAPGETAALSESTTGTGEDAAPARTPESELRALTARLLEHPGFAPELLALAAVAAIGPRARDWADRLRSA